MEVGEPVEEWMRKPKTGICDAAVTPSMCAYFSIFIKRCNSSRTGSPSRLPSLLRSRGHRLPWSPKRQLTPRPHAGLVCSGSVKKRRTREQTRSGNCTHLCPLLACDRAFFFFSFLLCNGAETVWSDEIPKLRLYGGRSLLVLECDWLAAV